MPLARPRVTRAPSISPDGKFALLGGADTVRVWDIPKGEQVGPALKHASIVMHAAFGPNEINVVTASADGLARVWDIIPTASPSSPLGAQPELDPGRSKLGFGFDSRQGIGRQVEVLTLDLSPDERPLVALREMAELLGTTEIKDVAEIPLDGNRLASLRRSLGERFPTDFQTTNADRHRWLSDQAYECERAAMWSAAVDFLTPLIKANPRGWEALRPSRPRQCRSSPDGPPPRPTTPSTEPRPRSGHRLDRPRGRRLPPGRPMEFGDRRSQRADRGPAWQPVADHAEGNRTREQRRRRAG